jgi:hypothetical protein
MARQLPLWAAAASLPAVLRAGSARVLRESFAASTLGDASSNASRDGPQHSYNPNIGIEPAHFREKGGKRSGTIGGLEEIW